MTSPLPTLPQHFDSTMRSCFASCAQKFYLEFCLGLHGRSLSIDLHAGACFALAIETVGRAVHCDKLPLDLALARAHAVFMLAWGEFIAIKETPKTKDRVWEAVEDYFNTYPPLTDHVQPYFVEGIPTFEFTFAEPLDLPGFPMHPVSNDPFIYCGRFDMLGTWGTKPVIRDEKTTTSIGAAWADQWGLRAQFPGYCWACRRLGIPVDTVIIRGVGILKTKFHQIEATPTYSDWAIERWLEQLRRDLIRIVQCWNETYFDFNLGESCNAYGGCQFRDPCLSPEPARWFGNYEVRHWNPLNRNPTEENSNAETTTTSSLGPTAGDASPSVRGSNL